MGRWARGVGQGASGTSMVSDCKQCWTVNGTIFQNLKNKAGFTAELAPAIGQGQLYPKVITKRDKSNIVSDGQTDRPTKRVIELRACD